MKLIAQILTILIFTAGNLQAQIWESANKIEFAELTMPQGDTYSCNDNMGNVYVTGKISNMNMSSTQIKFGGTTIINTITGDDIYIAKFNANGNLVWAKTYGDPINNQNLRVSNIKIDQAGNPVITGSFFTDFNFDGMPVYGFGNECGFIIKLNPNNGNCFWTKQFTAANTTSSTVNQKSVDFDANGNIYVVINYTGFVNFGDFVNPVYLTTEPSENNLLLVKMNSTGSVTRYINFTSSGEKDFNDVKVDAAGNIFFSGVYKFAGPNFKTSPFSDIYSFPYSDQQEVFFAKINSNFELKWMKSTSGTSTTKFLKNIIVDKNGNLYGFGNFNFDGGVNLDNSSISPFSSGIARDIFMFKYDSIGTLEWLKRAGSIYDDIVHNSTIANEGTIYICVSFKPAQSFPPLSINLNTGAGLVKYGIDGNAISFKSNDGGNIQNGFFNINSTGNGFLVGRFNSSAKFGNTTLNTSTGYSATATYIAKYFEILTIPSEVSRFYPTSGSTNTSVAIYGKNFNNATSVSFNNIISTDFRKVNDTIIIAKVPTGASTGTIKVEFTGGTNATSQNSFIVKSINNSNADWTMAIQNSTASNEEYIVESATDINGNVIYVGNFTSSINLLNTTLNSNGAEDMFIYKLNSNGTLNWAKSFGGGNIDKVNAVCTDVKGNIYITGFFTSEIYFGSIQLLNGIEKDIFIVKLNPAGDVVWAKRAGGLDGDDMGLDISCDVIGNISLTGSIIGTVNFDNITLSLSSLGSLKLFVAKYNNSGNALWAREARGGGNVYANSVAVDYNNNTYVMGIVPGELKIGGITLFSEPAWWIDYFIAKYDHQGYMLWAKKVSGHPSYDGKIITDADGNIYYTGTEKINNNDEIVVGKYNTEGVSLWKLVGQGPDLDFSNDIAINQFGELAICGQFNTTLAMGNLNLSGHALFGNEMFVARIDNNGNPISLHQAINDNTKTEAVSTLTYTLDNEIFVGGIFNGNATFGNTTLVANSGTDLFISKLTNTSTGIYTNTFNDLKIYPNPVNNTDIIYIDGCKQSEKVQFEIYDSIGKLVQEGEFDGTNCNINVQGLEDGIYILKTTIGNATFVRQQ